MKRRVMYVELKSGWGDSGPGSNGYLVEEFVATMSISIAARSSGSRG